MAEENVFDAGIKAVDKGFAGTIRSMMRGIREIVDATRGMAKSSAEGAKATGHAGHEAAKAVHGAAEGVKKASHEVEKSLHGVEKAEDHAEAHHIRYFRALGAHVRLLHGHMGELNASIGEVGNSLKEFLPALGALAAGGSLVGMFEMTHEAAEAAIAFDATAQKIGVTSEQLAGLNWAAKESGLAGDTMTRSMMRLNRTMGDAAAGKNKGAAALFKHLGISLKDAHGHMRSTMDLMPQLTDAFAATKDPTMQARMAFALFGRAGQELLPILLQGREGLDEMVKAGAKFADLGTDEERAKLKEFGHAWGEMDAAAEGFKTRLSTELAPALQPIVELARDWIMANRDWIAQGLAHRVQLLGEALRGIDLKEIILDIAHFVDRVRDLTRGHGELIAIVGAATLILGSPLTGAVRSAIEIFTGLGRVIMWLGALMWANPILAAIGLVLGGAVLLYTHWDWVKERVGAVFNWFSGQTGWVKALLTAIAPFVFLPMLIVEHWEPIKAFFTTLWAGITSAFDAAWAKIKPIVDAMERAVSWVQGSWIGRHLGGGVGPTGEAQQRASRQDAPAANAWGMPTFGPGSGNTPDLYRQGGPALAAAQQKGEVRVKVDLTNAPPGTKVSTSASGIAQAPETNVGYSNPLAFNF